MKPALLEVSRGPRPELGGLLRLVRGAPVVLSGLLLLLGSRSIPTLAVIPPGELFSKPFCLRDIYTKDEVIKTIKIVLKESAVINSKNDSQNLKPLFNVDIK